METKEVTLTLQKTDPDAPTTRDAAIRKRVMQIEDEETRNYLLDRVLPQMTRYGSKAVYNRKMYHRLAAASICVGALIPALAVGADSGIIKAALALCGTSITGINAYLQLRNCRSLWIGYQEARETLFHILYCYFNRAEAFAEAEDVNALLVSACEAALVRA